MVPNKKNEQLTCNDLVQTFVSSKLENFRQLLLASKYFVKPNVPVNLSHIFIIFNFYHNFNLKFS